MKTKIKVISIVSYSLILMGLILFLFLNNTDSTSFKNIDASTQLQNYSLLWDDTKTLLFVGTHDNKLIAFKDNQKIWEMEASGPFVSLKDNPQSNQIIAGNEDNNIYFVDKDTGKLQNKIDVERRIYDIDIFPSKGELLVSAGTKVNKHDLFIYSFEGELLHRFNYKIRMQGIRYTSSGQIISINNRGEIMLLDEKDGAEIKKISLPYELVNLASVPITREDTAFIALTTQGEFVLFKEDLQIVNQGKISFPMNVKGTSIAGLNQGENIAIGTDSGYFYLLDQHNKVIFDHRFPAFVSSIIQVKEDVLVTGKADFIAKAPIQSLANQNNSFGQALWGQILLVVWIIFGVFLAFLFINPLRHQVYGLGKTIWKHKLAYLMLLPTFILLTLFIFSPTFMAFIRAFTNWSKNNNTASSIDFIGLDNFRLMMTEGYFFRGLINLLIILIANVIKVLTMPLLVAWLVFSMSNPRQKFIFRYLYVLPIVVPSIVTILMWQQIYDPSIGLLNQVLGAIGLENLQRVWLGNENTALGAIIFMGFPFISALSFLVYYGGLIDIDRELYDAGKVDGCNRFRIFKNIQLPLIIPQINLLLLLIFISSIQDFTAIYVLTTGGPGTSTYVPGLELYLNATKFGRYGYASALGVVMFLFILIGTLVGRRLQSKEY